MSVQKNNIVAHQCNQHYHHFQLIIYPQENGTGNEPQYAAVYKILAKKNQMENIQNLAPE